MWILVALHEGPRHVPRLLDEVRSLDDWSRSHSSSRLQTVVDGGVSSDATRFDRGGIRGGVTSGGRT
jgi:hypothetical protein